MKNNRSVSAAIGEHLVLGELLKRNIEAYLAHGETQKGWDIIIAKESEIKRIQVKTIDWPTQYAVNGSLTYGFDFLVIVLLDRGKPRSRFFVIPVESLGGFVSPLNHNRVGGSRTLTMSNKAITERLKDFEDNWKIML